MQNRADKILVELGLVSTRSQARLLIKEGFVFVDGKQITKASATINSESNIEVRKETQYVGRGATKLEKAIERFKVDLTSKVVADVGASTGGFTEIVLKNGAAKVFAIDVGHDQLAKKLREDYRVVNLEGVNIKYPLELDQLVDIAVVDISYISLKLTLKNIFKLVKDEGEVIALVKPQFEAGRERIGKNGLVKDDQTRLAILEELYDFCCENSFHIVDAMTSPIIGKKGNVEYLFHFQKGAETSTFERSQLKGIL